MSAYRLNKTKRNWVLFSEAAFSEMTLVQKKIYDFNYMII